MTGSWGRWGPGDERGAANLVDEESARRGLKTVRDGRALSLAMPLSPQAPTAPNRTPMTHFFKRDGGDYAAGRAEVDQMGFSDDYVVMSLHGSTHIDALCHVWHQGQMYNGHAAESVTSSGASRCGIEKVGALVTRGVFLDAVSDGRSEDQPITADRLAEMCQATGIQPEPGDALIVRTGWLRHFSETGETRNDRCGLDRTAASWIVDHDFAIVGADNPAVEVVGSVDADVVPLHVSLLRDQGIYLLELMDLEELASASRSAFLLVVNPIAIRGATGAPVAPVAIL